MEQQQFAASSTEPAARSADGKFTADRQFAADDAVAAASAGRIAARSAAIRLCTRPIVFTHTVERVGIIGPKPATLPATDQAAATASADAARQESA